MQWHAPSKHTPLPLHSPSPSMYSGQCCLAHGFGSSKVNQVSSHSHSVSVSLYLPCTPQSGGAAGLASFFFFSAAFFSAAAAGAPPTSCKGLEPPPPPSSSPPPPPPPAAAPPAGDPSFEMHWPVIRLHSTPAGHAGSHSDGSVLQRSSVQPPLHSQDPSSQSPCELQVGSGHDIGTPHNAPIHPL